MLAEACTRRHSLSSAAALPIDGTVPAPRRVAGPLLDRANAGPRARASAPWPHPGSPRCCSSRPCALPPTSPPPRRHPPPPPHPARRQVARLCLFGVRGPAQHGAGGGQPERGARGGARGARGARGQLQAQAGRGALCWVLACVAWGWEAGRGLGGGLAGGWAGGGGRLVEGGRTGAAVGKAAHLTPGARAGGGVLPAGAQRPSLSPDLPCLGCKEMVAWIWLVCDSPVCTSRCAGTWCCCADLACQLRALPRPTTPGP